jgi:hypothetical protein
VIAASLWWAGRGGKILEKLMIGSMLLLACAMVGSRGWVVFDNACAYTLESDGAVIVLSEYGGIAVRNLPNQELLTMGSRVSFVARFVSPRYRGEDLALFDCNRPVATHRPFPFPATADPFSLRH